MADPRVSKWKQGDFLYLWRYTENTRNYPGWNVTASSSSCQSLVELLALMRDAQWPSHMKLRLSPPTSAMLAVPNNRRAAWRTADHLVLRHPKGEADPRLWTLELDGQDVVLTLGAARLGDLSAALARLPEGEDDFCIGPKERRAENQSLWFWHYPTS